MRKCIVFIILMAITGFQLFALSYTDEEINKQTFIYSIKGNDTLRLDKYDIPSIPVMDKPCLIFVFGGGFKGGERDNEYNVTYLENLAKSGYVAIGIDYRLGLQNFDANKMTNMEHVLGLLQNTIFMAVEDLFDATRFVYNNAENWNVNKGMIIANGSSAGAVTVLQGEYFISNKNELTKKLPEDFCYGGIISFAGAILTNESDLRFHTKPVPMLLFHGDADKNVPYNKIQIPDMGGFYGSKYIAEKLKGMQASHYFYDVINAAHEIAGDPMVNNLEEIRSFINKYVINKETLIINTQMREIGKPEMEKEFTIMDYIQTNYM